MNIGTGCALAVMLASVATSFAGASEPVQRARSAPLASPLRSSAARFSPAMPDEPWEDETDLLDDRTPPDGHASPAEYLQPPSGGAGTSEQGTASEQRSTPESRAAQPSQQQQQRSPSSNPSQRRRPSTTRLARAPNMFGDAASPGGRILFNAVNANGIQARGGASDLPLAGGVRHLKIAENNKPVPMDRVYFMYSHFHNALTSNFGGPGGLQADSDVDRYTIGFEKTFFDGWSSIDIRMPLTDRYEFTTGTNSVFGGSAGNLTLILKNRYYHDPFQSLVAGLGIGLPTGSDARGAFQDVPYRLDDEAVHLLPYVGYLATPTDDWFWQGFVQLDFAANGNTLTAGGQTAKYNEQNLLHADMSAGWWWYQNPGAPYLTRIAAVTELHYTTSIQDPDQIILAPGPGQLFALTGGRFDILNLTSGLQFQLGELSNFRVGCAVPLRTNEDRQFDAELQVSFNRNF